MSISLSPFHSKPPFRLSTPRIHPFSYTSSSLLTHTKIRPLHKIQRTHNFDGPFKKDFVGFSLKNACYGFSVKAKKEGGFGNDGERGEEEEEEEEEREVRGESSMPERFRYLTKEAPDKPLRWPWVIVLAFMLYCWRTVLWELSNWKKAIGAIFGFFGYILKLLLALIFHFIGDPLTSSIRAVESTFYTIRAFYSSIVAYAPIPELTLIIMLTSAVLSIAEATVPDSVNSQPYVLTVAGVIGFAAVRNYISELFFWTLLIGLFAYGRLVKKRDYVSSALPPAAVLAAVGEPWVRVIVIASYLALAIFHHAKHPLDPNEEKDAGAINRIPIPLFCAALAIGIRVVAKWAGYRHLTWMVA